MFRTRIVAITLALSLALSMAAGLAGCGASSGSYDMSQQSYASSSMAAPAAPAPSAAPSDKSFSSNGLSMGGEGNTFTERGENLSAEMKPDSGGPGDTASDAAAEEPPAPPAEPEQPRKLVKNGYLSLETKSFDDALSSLIKLVEESGGYVDSQSISGSSLRYAKDYYERNASLTVRVPAQRLDEVTGKMGELCHVVSQNESVSDITDRYYDAQSRLNTLRVKEARLLELLAKAEKLEDIIQLESALTDCQYEMDSLTGQLRRMDNLVSYSTLQIELLEVAEYQEIVTAPKNFGERLMDSLRYSGRSILRTLEDCLFWIIEQGPLVLIYLAFWLGIGYVLYRIFFKRWLARSRSTAKKAAPYTPYGNTYSVTPAQEKEPKAEDDTPEQP